MSYDANNRVSAIKTFGGYSSTMKYDGNGNMTDNRAFNSKSTSYVYDALDRLTNILLPDAGDGQGTIATTLAPNINDDNTAVTDGKNNTTNNVYDDAGRLVESKDAENRVTRYEYDAADNLIKIRDPNGNITRFDYVYGATQLVVTKTYADTKTEVYTFDSSGLLVSKKNARNTTATHLYDDFGNLESTTYSDSSPSVSYAYDSAYDRVSTATSGVGTYQYSEYDENARIKTIVDPWGNAVHLAYDALGRVHTIQVNSGEIMAYEYDTDGRLSIVTVGTRIFHYTYTGGNQVPDNLTRPNGSFTTYFYDYIYRLKEIRNKKSDNSEICSNLFTYDKAHMKVQEVINTNEANGYLPNKSFAFNNVNQLTTSGYAYDADGNMTNGFTPDNYPFTATYDAENRLKTISYTDPKGTHTATFTHNADGFIGKQVVDGVETRFIYDNLFNVLQERNSSNVVTRSYVWDPTAPGGIGGLLEMTQNGQHYNYLYDGKGNVSAVTDNNQAVVASYRYDGIGNLISKSGTLDQPYRFSTKRYYSGYGFFDFGHRQYLLARWLTRDPIGEAGGQNLYEGIGNNAVNYADPYGHSLQGAFNSIADLYKWTNGTLPEQTYGMTSPITQDLQNTPMMDDIRKQFKKKKCKSGTYYGNYQYKEFFTSGSVVGQTVGSFGATITNQGDYILVEAWNDWGLESGTRFPAYNGNNRHNASIQQMLLNKTPLQYPKSVLENRTTGPMKTVRTHYVWIEPNPCKCK